MDEQPPPFAKNAKGQGTPKIKFGEYAGHGKAGPAPLGSCRVRTPGIHSKVPVLELGHTPGASLELLLVIEDLRYGRSDHFCFDRRACLLDSSFVARRFVKR